MIEKHGDITDETPQPATPRKGIGPKHANPASCCGGRCSPRQPTTKQAADNLSDHAATRVADAVKDATQR